MDTNTPSTIHTDILILGAGIGGFETYRALEKALRKHKIKKTITIVDQNNYFTFVPLMHEVAVGAVEPSHATLPLANLVAGTPHKFIKARVKAINPETKTVDFDCDIMDCSTISYDFCVLAMGSSINFFDVPGANQYTHHIRTLTDALTFRNALIDRFDSPDSHISINVVGGGAAGVEVAGQISHLITKDLNRLYPKKTSLIRVIERSPALVAMLPPKAQALVAKRLKKLGVEVLLNTGVTQVLEDDLKLNTGETIESDLTLWAVGVRGTANELLPEKFCDRGRVPVTETLQHALASSLYAVGDVAVIMSLGKPIPQLGEAALHAGQYAAKHIISQYTKKTIRPFKFSSFGSLIPVGEHYALIVRGNFILAGFFAWWVRRTVYVWFMPGLARKLKIIMDWTLRLFGPADIISLKQK